VTLVAVAARDWAMVAFLSALALTFFVIAVVLTNLFRVVTSLKDLVDGVTSETVPLIGEVGNAMRTVNKELDRVDSIVGSVQNIASNAEVVSNTVQAAVTNPLVKAIAFAAGARKAGKAFRSKR
jgi:hypothetical protein